MTAHDDAMTAHEREAKAANGFRVMPRPIPDRQPDGWIPVQRPADAPRPPLDPDDRYEWDANGWHRVIDEPRWWRR